MTVAIGEPPSLFWGDAAANFCGFRSKMAPFFLSRWQQKNALESFSPELRKSPVMQRVHVRLERC